MRGCRPHRRGSRMHCAGTAWRSSCASTRASAWDRQLKHADRVGARYALIIGPRRGRRRHGDGQGSAPPHAGAALGRRTPARSPGWRRACGRTRHSLGVTASHVANLCPRSERRARHRTALKHLGAGSRRMRQSESPAPPRCHRARGAPRCGGWACAAAAAVPPESGCGRRCVSRQRRESECPVLSAGTTASSRPAVPPSRR